MSCWYTVRQGRIQRGAMGAKPPPWTSEIYWFQGVFRPQRVLSPPGKGKKNLSPPGQILEYAPGGADPQSPAPKYVSARSWYMASRTCLKLAAHNCLKLFECHFILQNFNIIVSASYKIQGRSYREIFIIVSRFGLHNNEWIFKFV